MKTYFVGSNHSIKFADLKIDELFVLGNPADDSDIRVKTNTDYCRIFDEASLHQPVVMARDVTVTRIKIRSLAYVITD